jgi:LPS sulfotransferase NodH
VKPVILIARPRSGTTAFRDLLKGHPQLAILGEIFHDRYIENENYYYNYFMHSVARTPSLAVPSAANTATLFKGYLDHLTNRPLIAAKSREWLLLSINYNSLHVLNTFWQNFYQPPRIIGLIKENNYHVIHMIRRNVVHAALSELRAKRTGVWHLRQGEPAPPEAASRLSVVPHHFLAELRARKSEIELLETAFHRYSRCLTIEYEGLYDESGRAVPEMTSRVEEFLALRRPIRLETRFRRTGNACLRDWIENYDALVEALSGTEFAAQLGP